MCDSRENVTTMDRLLTIIEKQSDMLTQLIKEVNELKHEIKELKTRGDDNVKM